MNGFFKTSEWNMLIFLPDRICWTEEMHMNTQILLLLLIKRFKVDISLKSYYKNA